MSGRSTSFSLTAAHVAQVHRAIADGGPGSGAQLHTDADYDHWVARIMKCHPAPGLPTLLFAYGSLIWRPEIEHVREEIGIARGWHRSFCLRMLRFRGTPDEPGLMMALDRGGQCRGVLYELPNDDLEGQLGRLFRREFTYKPPNSMPRWIKVETGQGSVPALGFVMNRASSFYAGSLPLEAVAEVLARACGHVGSGAEYLLNTVTHLEARGIRDRNLWRLQALVAECIERDRAVASSELIQTLDA
ncbi:MULTISPECIES: gamma-glutamylcyclotransferase [Sinorhizobium]|uniref:gamma-glutamylcyclotransferase n=1 Tax=Sinorhizobium TaxID=28105 RepID=UPI000BEA76D7|nr:MULTISPECIES: gamma-glutamylcyclotransferase [Sinorhizobium]PDT53792.1 gamma-glutamylcyclotransferase [Sinorhizobium sp. NG07B]POH30852.1 cation transporter [Sinorhizobium americanum]